MRALALLVLLFLFGCTTLSAGDVKIRNFGQVDVVMEFNCDGGIEPIRDVKTGFYMCPLTKITANSEGLSEIGGGTIGGVVGAAASVFGGGDNETKLTIVMPSSEDEETTISSSSD